LYVGDQGVLFEKCSFTRRAISGRPDADIHAGVNFAITAFSEVGLEY